MPYIIFALLGYASGSILYSKLLPRCFRHVDITQISNDKNPGAGNVFKHFGARLGTLCLICDIFKGTLPVAMCLYYLPWNHPLFALVLAAPVLGHARSGKAVAVSFGVFIGLLPFSSMVFYLVVPFLFFSVVLRINPHAWRVILSFLCFTGAAYLWVPVQSLRLGAVLITLTVVSRHVIYVREAHERMHLDKGWDLSILRGRR